MSKDEQRAAIKPLESLGLISSWFDRSGMTSMFIIKMYAI
jgi:hypothetical protein